MMDPKDHTATERGKDLSHWADHAARRALGSIDDSGPSEITVAAGITPSYLLGPFPGDTVSPGAAVPGMITDGGALATPPDLAAFLLILVAFFNLLKLWVLRKFR